jgi:tRNA1Val (adenine37-N6)-methyltransferase
MNPKHTETIDELRAYSLRAIQPGDGYRFSIDPLLLCDFARVGPATRIIDLGTGCGIIPMIMSRKAVDARIVGVELQEEMAGLAARNAALNGLEGQIEVVCDDILSVRKRFPVSSFDLVIANPPYRKADSGRVSPKAGRDLARHESSAGLTDFLSVAKYLVKPGGKICFIYHVSRLAEFIAAALLLKLAPLRLRMVHGSVLSEARMVLLELAKGRRGELQVQAPLFVYDTHGAYSGEMKRILGDDNA